MSRVAFVLLVSVAGCVDPLTNDTTNVVTWHAKNVQGYAQTATGEPADTALGWGFTIEGDVARWHVCAAVDACGETARQAPKTDVLAVERVGSAPIGDGGTVDVVKLTLAPGRKYVVPYTDPVKAQRR